MVILLWCPFDHDFFVCIHGMLCNQIHIIQLVECSFHVHCSVDMQMNTKLAICLYIVQNSISRAECTSFTERKVRPLQKGHLHYLEHC